MTKTRAQSDFGQVIAWHRKVAGVTQHALATQIGRSTTFISAVERGLFRPKPEDVRRIAEVLHLDPSALRRD